MTLSTATSIGLQVEPAVEAVANLKPALRKRLATELRTYESVKARLDKLQLEVNAAKQLVEQSMIEAGESRLDFERDPELRGYKATIVAGTRTVLDEQKLVAQGVSTAQIAAAKVTVPTKPYVLITVPK